jgi:hypothetical protein
MLCKRKFDPAPRGVPLEAIQRMLSTTTLKVSRDGDSLVAEHDTTITRLTVIPPAPDNIGDDPISAVVQIITDLPKNIPSFLTRERISILNQMAVLGALIVDNDRCFIGSRLTTFENESAWNLYVPFLLFATIAGSDSHLEAVQTVLGMKEPATGKSAWTADDFRALQSALSDFSVSTTGDLSLTAEIGLRPGALSAAVGDHMTALLRLDATSPHPALGGGLLCLLHMPHSVSGDRLPAIIQDLNRREMSPRDQPPHFGAWCQGRAENTLAYVSFLPNALHEAVAGVALNVSIWAVHRAHWADAYLASVGVHS